MLLEFIRCQSVPDLTLVGRDIITHYMICQLPDLAKPFNRSYEK